jgi:hypothetical protein
MPSKSPRSSRLKSREAPPVATNFRQIKGINQLIEARLHRAGIKTLDDLGNLQPEQIFAALGTLRGVTVNQIVEQDWVGQARKLTGKKGNGSLESEGFIVNLFLSKRKQVHSTQMLHVNSDVGEKWDGWDSQRLLDFVVNHSGLVLLKVETAKAEITMTEPVKENAEKKIAAFAPSSLAVTPDARQTAPHAPPQPEIFFGDFQMIPSYSELPGNLLRQGEPFAVRLSIDTGKIKPKFEAPFDYTAAIVARAFDTPQQFSLSQTTGVIGKGDESIVVNIPKQDLVPGTYRLEAALTVRKESQSIGKPAQMRTIFQVF